MNCPSCRRPLSDEALFCSDCGVSLSTAKIISTTNEPLNHTTNPVKGGRKDPLIGEILDSKYKLIERLGEGGMGAVYRAQRLHIGDEVAVKVLRRDLVIEDKAIERFRREARSAAMIRHQNVVSIHDFNDASGDGSTAYIVMELVKGDSLRRLLQRDGRMTAARSVALMRDICAGVGVAHRQNVLHRDLKPDNVIVTPPTNDGDRETAKVVDFGLAKLRDVGSGLTQTGAVLGTLYYMSPEQCSGDELDSRADVYSLGAMLYEMLTGSPPFEANSLAALIAKHLHEPPPPFPPSLNVPPMLASACFRALAKNRDARQKDANAFSKELQAAIDSATAPQSSQTATTISPPEPQVVEQAPKSSGIWKWLVGSVAGILFLLILLVVAGVAIKLGTDRMRQNDRVTETQNANISQNGDGNININDISKNTNKAIQTQQGALPSVSPSPNQGTADKSTDLRGTWTGTYGHFDEPAKLIVKTQKDGKFDGFLEQGNVQVSFTGTIDSTTRKVSMKQTTVIKDPDSSWLLGTDSGILTGDGKEMTGKGQDKLSGQLGLTYDWTFKRNESRN